MKTLWLALLSVLVGPISTAYAEDFIHAATNIPEFHQVSEGIYRGGHPETQGLQDLA